MTKYFDWPLAAFVLIVCVVSGYLFSNPSTQISFGDVINPLAALAAAYAGAAAAFRYQNNVKTEDLRARHVSAGNQALMTLFQQANTLSLYQIDFVNPHRENPARSLAIQPSLPFQEGRLVFDLKDLDFLAEPKTAQILMDLVLEESRYSETIKAINVRSLHHLEVVQPKLQKEGLTEGKEFTKAECLSALGELDFLKLERLTEAVVMHIDRTVDSLVAAKNRLRKAVQEKYPEAKFIDFELIANPPKSIFAVGSEKTSDVAAAVSKQVASAAQISDGNLLAARSQKIQQRFEQLNRLLVGHVEGGLQYLLAVNGGGAVAMLGLVGAVEKWRVQNWPYWVLATFVLGVVLSGVLRVLVLIHAEYLHSGWIKDTDAFFLKKLEWSEIHPRDKARVQCVKYSPWVIGLISLLCFILGTFATGYLFATLR